MVVYSSNLEATHHPTGGKGGVSGADDERRRISEAAVQIPGVPGEEGIG